MVNDPEARRWRETLRATAPAGVHGL
jgi:hypothetical protein